MANQEQLKILKQGVDVWNKWREENPAVEIDLSEADLREANLSGANFTRANLWRVDLRSAQLYDACLVGADLSEADLSKANLTSADLSVADLSEAKLSGTYLSNAVLFVAKLTGANLREANLTAANLGDTDFRGADLRKAKLNSANLNFADLSGADLSKSDLRAAFMAQVVVDRARVSESLIYGISVWGLKGKFDEQRDLVITREGEAVITVDSIEIAQFIYLILNNEKIRDVFNMLTSKAVLILGRFAIPERKAILDVLKNQLREYNLLPIVFDFDRPTDKDFTETIKTLAGLSYFVIADVTNPKSSPLELQATVPDYQIPFVPIIQEGEGSFAMMVDLQKKYDWVLDTVSYDSEETLIKVLKPLIIDRAMKKRQELRLIKAQEPEVISGKDYLEKGKV